MKRGLVLLDPGEVSPSEFQARIRTLQTALRDAGLMGALMYGDVYRSGDVTYFSNLCLYWNEGILAVPAIGEPAFFTKLSPRVHPWMRRTSILSDLRSGPDLAHLVADFFREAAPGALALMDAQWWPTELAGALEVALDGRRLHDWGDWAAKMRQRLSPNERGLLEAAATVAAKSVAEAIRGEVPPPARAGRAEWIARSAGVEDVVVHCHHAANPGQAVTVEVRPEYRGYWTIAARVVARPDCPWLQPLAAVYGRAIQGLEAGMDPVRWRTEVLSDVPVTLPGRLALDLMAHTDLETGGDYRVAEYSGPDVQVGAVAGLRLSLTVEGLAPAVLADTFVLETGGAVRLTGALPL